MSQVDNAGIVLVITKFSYPVLITDMLHRLQIPLDQPGLATRETVFSLPHPHHAIRPVLKC